MRSIITKTLSVGGNGNPFNEDVAASGRDYIFVIDGATGLSDNKYMDMKSDAQWFARRTALLLAKSIEKKVPSIEDALRDIMGQLSKEWKGPASEAPSASIAVWRVNGNYLEYFGLGDCDSSLFMVDGRTCSWCEDKLNDLDRRALAEMVRISNETGCSMKEARMLCSDLIIHNRDLKNTGDGYWCLDVSGDGIAHARRERILLDQCSSIFICSDGFAQLIDFGAADSITDLHEKALREDLEDLKDELFALQEEDSDMKRVPRFKFRDDTSVALMIMRED